MTLSSTTNTWKCFCCCCWLFASSIWV